MSIVTSLSPSFALSPADRVDNITPRVLHGCEAVIEAHSRCSVIILVWLGSSLSRLASL